MSAIFTKEESVRIKTVTKSMKGLNQPLEAEAMALRMTMEDGV